jgi:hypothetical protein
MNCSAGELFLPEVGKDELFPLLIATFISVVLNWEIVLPNPNCDGNCSFW